MRQATPGDYKRHTQSMSFFTSDQFAAVHKNNLTNLAKLSNSTLEGIQKLTELNLQAAKAAMAEGQVILQAVSANQDPGLSVQGNVPQSAADKAIEYARHVCEIASQAQADLARAVEEQYEQQQRNVQAFVDAFVKNAPAGSEAISATLQATLDNATQSYRAAQALSQQLAGLASATFTATPGAATGPDRQPTQR
ncbi:MULTISPECIES: TIGR01841 family phasin [Cupriavidus]|nr:MULTISPECIES: TIGR01841 family phasin [Cupriavidus]